MVSYDINAEAKKPPFFKSRGDGGRGCEQKPCTLYLNMHLRVKKVLVATQARSPKRHFYNCRLSVIFFQRQLAQDGPSTPSLFKEHLCHRSSSRLSFRRIVPATQTSSTNGEGAFPLECSLLLFNTCPSVHCLHTLSGKVMRRVLRALSEKRDLGDLSTIEDGASLVFCVCRLFNSAPDNFGRPPFAMTRDRKK